MNPLLLFSYYVLTYSEKAQILMNDLAVRYIWTVIRIIDILHRNVVWLRSLHK